jgi:hypothetical protein
MAGARVPATGHIVSTAGATGASIVGSVLYVNKVGSDGWLQAKADTGGLVPLAKYTKLKATRTDSGRTFFKVLDGPSIGKVLSLGDANAKEYLGTKAPAQSLAQIVVTYGRYVEAWYSPVRKQNFQQQLATLEVGSIKIQVTMNSDWSGRFYPLPAGDYTVLLPDAPHNKDMTRYYREGAPNLRYDQVWFPIKYGDNSRYVHVGNVSDGCVTVVDLDRWNDVHEALVSHRGPDGLSVAKLTVRGTPEKAR